MTPSQLLRIEIYKLSRIDFYLFVGLFVIITLILPLTASKFALAGLNGPDLLNFMHTVVIRFMVLGVIIAAAREFSDGVNRKRLLNGYKRHELFLSQLIVVGIYSLSLVFMAIIGAVILSLYYFQNLELLLSPPAFWYLGFWLSTFAYGLFAVFLVNLFGRALWPILMYFLLAFVESILKLLGMYTQAQFGVDRFTYFRPLDLMSDLFKFEGLGMGLIVAIAVYLLLFQGISLLILKKIDI